MNLTEQAVPRNTAPPAAGIDVLQEPVKTTTKPVPKLVVADFNGEKPIESFQLTAKAEHLNYLDYLIDLDEDLPPPPVAMSIIDNSGDIQTLFSKGNFSILTGAAKAKKTFLASKIMAAAVSGRKDYFHCPTHGMNVWFCTEQSRHKVQQIGKRIATLAGTKDNLKVFTLRTLEPLQRRELICQVLRDTPNLNFVVIDGIIDLDVDPILQADQAQGIIQDLMRWSEQYNIHILCVLHFNKTVTTLLGHLGSFAHRKADAVISVTKDKENENVSIVEPVDTREKPFKPFSFTIDENGVPQILGEIDRKQPAGKKALLAKQIPDETHRLYLGEIYKGKPEGFTYANLVDKIKLKYQEYGIEFGQSKAREFISHCDNLGIIAHNGKSGRAAKYIFQPAR